MTRLVQISPREPLPNRRPCIRIPFVWTWNGSTSDWAISVGFRDDGRIAEVFLAQSPKIGSEYESMIQDSCVLVSHLLQRGMTIAEISRSLTREGIMPDAPAGSIVGWIVEKMMGALQ